MQGEDQFDRILPARQRVFGQAVDQVEVEIVKACFSGIGYRFDYGEKIVDAFEHPQFFGICRLNAEADAVDSSFAKVFQLLEVERARVGFDADLRVSGQGKGGAQGLENGIKLGRGQQGGSPAAEKNRMNSRIVE